MKFIYVLFFLFLGITCCACGTDTLQSHSLDSSFDEEESVWKAEMVQRPPQTEYTLEELTNQTTDFRDYIVTSYQKIQELAAESESYEAGKELTRKIEEQYGERITELINTDFTGMTEEELKEYLTEFTSLTTIIREAKDALTLG